MSAKTKRIERGQRFRRAWRGENRARAVSPVVATLILILIAVAAAAALYLWLVVWQGNITGGIGTQHAEPTLTVGGSTSVYPFSSLATTWFEQNNTDVVISNNEGGTGAGMIALCDGNIQLGASSTPQTVALLESSYGCSSTYASTIVITTIAYDAVDVVIQGTNAHGLLSISADTLNAVYEAGSSTAADKYIGSINGVLDATVGVTPVAATSLTWDQIPAVVEGVTVVNAASPATTPTVLEQPTGVVAAPLAGDADSVAGVAGSALANDIVTPVTDASPCGFTICAGPFTATATAGPLSAIVPVERSDASGTTQTFEAKLLGYGSGPGSSDSSFAGASVAATAQDSAASFANLGYGGCGSNNLLTDCGFTYAAAQQGNGNPGVLSIVASNPNAIGYASDGLARTTTGIGSAGIVPFLGLGEGVSSTGVPQTIGDNGLFVATGSTYAYGGVVPTTGTSGTISAGLTSNAAVNNYVGGRPFELVSLEPLTGQAQEFVTFITDPANNAALASATDEVGLYQVV